MVKFGQIYSIVPDLRRWILILSMRNPLYGNLYRMVPPKYVSWIINPSNYFVIPTINHRMQPLKEGVSERVFGRRE